MPTAYEDWTVQPHGPLVALDDRLLGVEGEIVMPLGRFPRRMTLVGLAGGRTAIFSAIALRDAEMARIEALGRPAFLIVPSDFHRLDAKAWKRRYPDIRVLAPPGARAKVEQVVPVDATDDQLDDTETRFVAVAGAGGHEAALIVRRPGGASLIVNDVIANVANPSGLGTRLMSRLFGFGASAPQVPRTIRAMLVSDKAALAAQFRAWAAEPELRRIVPSHGDVIDQGPAATLHRLADGLAPPG
jgi:hypothetical protein